MINLVSAKPELLLDQLYEIHRIDSHSCIQSRSQVGVQPDEQVSNNLAAKGKFLFCVLSLKEQ